MPLTPVQRTLRTCAILSAITLLAACLCCYGCSVHTFAHGPLAPETPSDGQTTLWASGAYLGLFLFVISFSVLLLTVSSMRRHKRMQRKAARARAMLAAMKEEVK